MEEREKKRQDRGWSHSIPFQQGGPFLPFFSFPPSLPCRCANERKWKIKICLKWWPCDIVVFWGAQWVLSGPSKSLAVSAGLEVFGFLSAVLFCGQLQALFVLGCFWSVSMLEEGTSHNCFKTESGIVATGGCLVTAGSKMQTARLKKQTLFWKEGKKTVNVAVKTIVVEATFSLRRKIKLSVIQVYPAGSSYQLP